MIIYINLSDSVTYKGMLTSFRILSLTGKYKHLNKHWLDLFAGQKSYYHCEYSILKITFLQAFT